MLKLDPAKDYAYEVLLAGDSYKGTVRAAPTGRPVKLASLSCDGGSELHGELVANVQAQSPDFIAFLGDQVRADSGGYGCLFDRRSNDRSILCFLRKYAVHGWAWRDTLRNTPSITLPDDEDVFHHTLWGAAGKAADISDGYGAACEDSGGYKMSVEFVNAVHRCQTGNLPDPADPSACRSGISVYFTRHAWGPLDFAILADRQFKSAPKALFPAAGIAAGWATAADSQAKASVAADLDLLGIRQENFLSRWAKAPAKGSKFRIALSQAPFCAAETLPKAENDDRRLAELQVYPTGQFPPDDEPKADFESNGWPQAPRLKALKFLGEAHAVHLCGDRQLGMTGQYGLENGAEGPWWISSPAIDNSMPRRWMPAKEGKQHRDGDPKGTGAFADAFGNPFTIHAVANPQDRSRDPETVRKRATGYTMTTWDPSGKVRVETWPSWASPSKPAPDNRPYEGWPITIDPASGKRVE
ncbi:hypothetical protein [Haloferula sp. BvORR071]|uniref:hypothetical protein n=1 Tax=Haloferula sp. BvORR071 TaxID=1396141 RepID=UPI00054F3C81|nr:hypothetical protein [Haloferula sp. BvORR071]